MLNELVHHMPEVPLAEEDHLVEAFVLDGLNKPPKLFQNLRSTRETELAEHWPLHVVCAWIGNSQLIAARHYLQVTDDHFAQAAGTPPQGAAPQSPTVQDVRS